MRWDSAKAPPPQKVCRHQPTAVAGSPHSHCTFSFQQTSTAQSRIIDTTLHTHTHTHTHCSLSWYMLETLTSNWIIRVCSYSSLLAACCGQSAFVVRVCTPLSYHKSDKHISRNTHTHIVHTHTYACIFLFSWMKASTTPSTRQHLGRRRWPTQEGGARSGVQMQVLVFYSKTNDSNNRETR